MIADTSAWVEFLRATGSPADRALEAAMRDRTLLMTGPVLMELLTGARDADEWRDVERLAFAFEFAHVEGPGDWIDAADLRRRMRLAGATVASVLDCLVAVVAIRLRARVLHADADFDAIAEHSSLDTA